MQVQSLNHWINRKSQSSLIFRYASCILLLISESFFLLFMLHGLIFLSSLSEYFTLLQNLSKMSRHHESCGKDCYWSINASFPGRTARLHFFSFPWGSQVSRVLASGTLVEIAYSFLDMHIKTSHPPCSFSFCQFNMDKPLILGSYMLKMWPTSWKNLDLWITISGRKLITNQKHLFLTFNDWENLCCVWAYLPRLVYSSSSLYQ